MRFVAAAYRLRSAGEEATIPRRESAMPRSPEWSDAGAVQVPTDYEAGYTRAQAVDPDIAARYIAHTTVGDPAADALTAALSALPPEEAAGILRAGMEAERPSGLRDLPAAARDFFEESATPPAWVGHATFAPGIRMFHRNSQLVLGAMVAGTLVEGFSTSIARSFFITGRLREQGVRRLRQNNRHMLEIFLPGGLERGADGWKLAVRVRLVHAQVRRLLDASAEWDHAAWGTPISAAHVGYASTAFSARLLRHLERLGAVFDDEERQSFMQVWRYSGFLMGVPGSILYRDEDEARRLYDVGGMCEPEPGVEAAVMANALVNSAPLVVGIDAPVERQRLAGYVYTMSRALIGDELAGKLRYPERPTFGVLAWFRMQERYRRLAARLFPTRVPQGAFNRFSSLLEASAYDEGGIGYALPDHVHSEESSRW